MLGVWSFRVLWNEVEVVHAPSSDRMERCTLPIPEVEELCVDLIRNAEGRMVLTPEQHIIPKLEAWVHGSRARQYMALTPDWESWVS